jgi:diguanylate cyclase (GGDEF)-like protein
LLAVVAAACGLFTGSLYGGPLSTSDLLPGAILLAVFVAAEATQLHVEFHRETYSISVSDLPLVLGLFFVDPLVLLAVRLVAAAALMIVRRRPPIKILFNLCLFTAETALALTVFHALAAHPVEAVAPWSWLAAAAAIAVASVVSHGSVLAVIVLTDLMPPWREALGGVGTGLLSALLNTAIALIVVVSLSVAPWSGVLIAILGVVLYVAYRGYARSRKQHQVLDRVYRFSRLLEQVRGMDGPLAVALQEIRAGVNAEVVRLGLLLDDGDLVVTEVSDGPVVTRPAPRADALTKRVLDSRGGLLFDRRRTPDVVLAALHERGAEEVIAVPLRSGSRVRGYLELQDRQGEMTSFSGEDVHLVENLGAHLTSALENQELVARLRHAAYHDQLTDLPTRSKLSQHIDAAIEAGGEGVVALVQLDLDRFKEVNDSLGHTWGDQLLVLVGGRLRAASPPDAMVARVGADEFAVVSRVPDGAAAAELARSLRAAVSTSYPLAGLTIDAAATAGVALAPEHGDDGSTLMRRVDVALSNAKNVGRHVTVYDPSMEQESLQRLRLVTELRAALGEGQVVVRYQPKVNLRSRELVGVEALVRWNHPEFGEVVPDRFVPLAEVTGLIGILTDHVLRISLEQCRAWLDRDLRIPVAVNLSARTLLDAEFPDRVAALLAEHEVPAEMVSFELTESSVMTDPDRMKPVLHRLHELGTGLSIDDFGTGYSSLSQLRRLPVDEVKIDKEFVFSMGTDLGDLAIVRAIIELGHSLGLRVVAEGVEDELARDLLAGNDCDVIQGYLVSRALDPDRLDAWLSARTAIRPGQPGVRGRRLHLLTA